MDLCTFRNPLEEVEPSGQQVQVSLKRAGLLQKIARFSSLEDWKLALSSFAFDLDIPLSSCRRDILRNRRQNLMTESPIFLLVEDYGKSRVVELGRTR